MRNGIKKQILIGLSGWMLVTALQADVQLNIDAHDRHRRPINPHIYGVNIANWAADHFVRMCQPWLTNAGVTVVRYGATNIERYNWRNNRMYNVISLENQYVPMCWRTFVRWCHEEMQAEPFLQVPAFGRVASDDDASNYNSNQPINEIAAWVEEAGTNVNIWGIGNEPFIAWKLVQYQGDGYAYNDGAHGDQIFLEDLAPEAFFPRWIDIGAAIRGANEEALILGPTPANWYLYWGTDYSELCPVTRARAAQEWPDHLHPYGYTNDAGWLAMAAGVNQFDGRVFPGRGGQPDFQGWEKNDQTGAFNDKRNMNLFVKSVAEYAAANGGTQVCDYLDFHRYMNTDNDYAAVQEIRDLWEPGFQSSDMETGNAYDARVLDRFQHILDHYYTNQMGMSLSEYDYFYWRGHPDEPQIAALGEIDYLGTFARYGVQLACNWYVGEPDQSGGGYHHAADAAKQAMFDEHGRPNPKYWAFRLMSLNFRDQAVTQVASEDNDLFSVYAGVDTNRQEFTVLAQYKGVYHPWYDPHHPGALIEGQGSTNATMVISNFNITGVRKVQRYGRYDPFIVDMEPGGVSLVSNAANVTFTYDFQPLSIYAFTFCGMPAPPAEDTPDTYLHVTPDRLDFGAFETGIETIEEEDHGTHEVTVTTNYKYCIKITNNRNSNTAWSVSESCAWLNFLTATSGVTEVTDRVFLEVSRDGYAVGTYSTAVTVATSEGTVQVPVTMEVVPRAAGGEVRICDFDTGSLAHTWVVEEPYAIGFYDQHGQPADMEGPYIYTMSLDYDERSQFGGLASMRVDFDRSNGDTAAGNLYLAFGTYGHGQDGETSTPTTVWVPAGEPLSNYVFKFDVRTKTEGPGFTRTELTTVITDNDGHVGKPGAGLESYRDRWVLDDGLWQTIAVPLDSPFYDWSYPGGQDGRTVAMNFGSIRQIEFMPWVGREDKRGTVWIDNIRVETLSGGSNRFPVAVAEQSERLVGTNVAVQLCATNSYDPDGTVVAYAWTPADHLSDASSPTPVFVSTEPGTYRYELTITDNHGLKNRNPAQVVVNVQDTLIPADIHLYRDAAMLDEVIGTASNSMDIHVRLTCIAGGNPSSRDFTIATVSSDDPWTGDAHNHTDPIEIVLEETAVDSKVFAGQFSLGAFSDEMQAEIGVSEGCTVSVSNNGYGISIPVGRQWYGRQHIIDHIEDGDGQFNTFDGVWNTYDDTPNGNSSVVDMHTTNDAARPGSTQAMFGEATLHLDDPGLQDQLFAGIMTKLTPYSNDIPVAVYDLSSTSGYRGISFWLKGNGTKVSVVLKSLAITNYDDYLYTIDNTPGAWRKYTLPFDRFAQEGWGNEAVARDTALRHVNAIQFKFASKQDGEYNRVFVDDLALFGGDKCYLPHVVYHKYNHLSMEGFDGGFLANPGFEESPGGWQRSGNAAYRDWGGWRMVLENWSGTNHGRAWQTLTIDSNTAYQFSINAWRNAGFNGEAYLEMLWYDAASNLLGSDSMEITDSLTENQHDRYTLSWRWPAENAAYVEVGVRSLNGVMPPYSDNAVQFDNAAFAEYGYNADDGWISGWIPGSMHSYSTNCAEGKGALRIASTNHGWLAGMFVAPYESDVTRTNFATVDGFALKARRPDNYATNGTCLGRIRMAVATDEDPVARTRWYPVGAAEWEDYILFPKARFLTAATVDADDPAARVAWSNAWTDIRRVIIEYGPSRENQQAFDLLLDDFRPYADTYVADNIIDPPITNSGAVTTPLDIYTDAGIPAATEYDMLDGGSYDADSMPGDAPEGSTCLEIHANYRELFRIACTQAVRTVMTTDTVSQAWNVDLSGNYLYVADASGGVRIYDISVPDTPVEVADIPVARYARDVCVKGNRLYLAAEPMQIYDITAPTGPVLLGSVDVGTAAGIEVDGNYAYVVRRDTVGALAVVDVSDPASPVMVGFAPIGSVDCHVAVSNDHAYVALLDTGFHAVDIADKNNPDVLTTNRMYYPMAVAIKGGYAYVGDLAGVSVMDLSDPAQPLLIRRIDLSFGYLRDICIDGDRLYAAGQEHIYVLDISTPANPQVLGLSSELGANTYGIKVKNGYAYVANYTRGLTVLDVSQAGGTMDLGDYADGYLKFSVRTPVNLRIEVNAGGKKYVRDIEDMNWSGLNQWQELKVSLREWGIPPSRMDRVFVPFSCRPVSSSSRQTCFVDHIRFTNLP